MRASRKYNSSAMQERRERIIDAGGRLIVERGADRFSMLEVSREAGVSEKTLYNVIGSRNNLIACAVERYQQELARSLSLPPDYELDDILSSLSTVCDRLVADERWGKAIADLYFSSASDTATYGLLRMVAQTHIDPAVAMLARQGQIRKSAPVAIVAHHFANTAYSLLQDWALRRITDDALPRHLTFALLAALFALVKEPTRQKLSGMMSQISGLIDGHP